MTKQLSMINKIECILGIISGLYFVILLMSTAFSLSTLIYPFMSMVLFGLYAYGKKHGPLYKKLSQVMQRIIICGVIILMGMFGYVQYHIISYSFAKYDEEVDYVLVLGALVNGDTLSLSLQYRMEAALEYAKKYPNAKLVVSGGQGEKEYNSEAYYMKKWLMEQGVKEDRILMEDQSKNTDENIKKSKQVMDQDANKNYDVVVVTNGFHCYRAIYLCERYGIDAHAYAARSHLLSAPHYYIREGVALLKDMI